jgi:imidazole glycerol-phosphate synthase subunit HisF
VEGRKPNIEILHQIADECFMPLSYGGAVKDMQTAMQIFSIGFEKIVINTQAFHQLDFVTELSRHFGAQAVVASIDAKKNMWGKYNAFTNDGTQKIDVDVVEWAKRLEQAGAGEIIITSMEREGTWTGYDVELTRMIAHAVNVPVIANGGAGSIEDIGEVVKKGRASAVCLGSMVVFQQKGMGVLVNFPDKRNLEASLV